MSSIERPLGSTDLSGTAHFAVDRTARSVSGKAQNRVAGGDTTAPGAVDARGARITDDDRGGPVDSTDVISHIASTMRRPPLSKRNAPIQVDVQTGADGSTWFDEGSLVAQLGQHGVPVSEQDDISHLNGAVPTEAQLSDFVSRMARDPDFPAGYVKLGCQERAIVLDDMLKSKGFNRARMYVETDPAHRLHLKSKYTQDFTTGHVAPMVMIRTPAGTVEPRMVDPSLSTRALTVDDWLRRMGSPPVHAHLWKEGKGNPSSPEDDQAYMARMLAYGKRNVELYNSYYRGRISWEQMQAGIRASMKEAGQHG